MRPLEKLLTETVIATAIEQGDVKPNGEDLARLTSEILPKFAEIAADVVATQIKKDAKRELKRRRRQRERFERELAKHWARPLQLLQLTVEIAEEVGIGTIESIVPTEDHGNVRNHALDALAAIHARGCQMSRAILALLRSGFADDAHARWRSLHELAVVASFISEHGEDVAERYLSHGVVQQRKLARAYKAHEIQAELDPLTQAEIDVLDERYHSLVGKYGESFGFDYGWASSALGKNRPTFVDIEEVVGLDHLRPYYQMANHNVHPNAHAAFFKLGLADVHRGEVLLTGPSTLGLADPGHGVALSLTHITASLVSLNPSIDQAVALIIVNALQKETGEAFLRAHKEAETIAPQIDRQMSASYHPMKRSRWASRLASGLSDQLEVLLSKRP